jgi:hypothetical protein
VYGSQYWQSLPGFAVPLAYVMPLMVHVGVGPTRQPVLSVAHVIPAQQSESELHCWLALAQQLRRA